MRIRLLLRRIFRKKWVFLPLLLVLLVSAACWSLLAGEIELSLTDLLTLASRPDSLEYSVVMDIRLPRLLLAFAVGGSLSLAGAVLQGIYRNPLVEPFTLGISGGASLGVAAVLVMGLPLALQNLALPAAGFVGALVSMLLVYVLGIRKASGNTHRMLLIGVMISFVSSSLLMFFMSIATTQDLQSIVYWTMGSLDESDETLIGLLFWGSLVVLVLTHFFARPLNALRLGEEQATHLGVNVPFTIRVLFVLTSLLTGLCVSVAGIIGFVGLVVPHLLRRMVGSDYRLLLSASFLGGGWFLVVCDILARTLLSPNELPVGVLTGIIGGLLFIVLLSRSTSKKSI